MARRENRYQAPAEKRIIHLATWRTGQPHGMPLPNMKLRNRHCYSRISMLISSCLINELVLGMWPRPIGAASWCAPGPPSHQDRAQCTPSSGTGRGPPISPGVPGPLVRPCFCCTCPKGNKNQKNRSQCIRETY